MNAYWMRTEVIKIRQHVHNGYGEYLGDDFPEDWLEAALVFAETPSKARYMFWKQVINPSVGDDFDEFLTWCGKAHLIEKDITHECGIARFEDTPFYQDDYWCEDYNLIPDPIWREIALRFWGKTTNEEIDE